MDKEHKVSVYDMVKELNLKEVTPEINSREVYIEQAEINRPALQLAGFFENFAKNRVTSGDVPIKVFLLTLLISTTSSDTNRCPLRINSKAASLLPIPLSPVIRIPSPNTSTKTP